jgi:hypothetical protein
VQQGAETVTVSDGASVVINAPAVGQSASAAVTFTYGGSGSTPVTSVDLIGSSDFLVSATPRLPVTLASGQSILVTLRYTATRSLRATARMVLTYGMERAVATFSLNLAGTAPEVVFSYVAQPSGNATLLNPGNTVAFPDTLLDATSTTQMVVANRGSGNTALNAVSVEGEPFRLAGLPLMPFALESGRDVRFNVVFAPRQAQIGRGTLQIDIPTGRASFPLQGAGVASRFTYELILSDLVSPLQPGGAIALPDASVGETSFVMLRVKNSGNAEGRIAAISLSGAGFRLENLPVLPAVLPPNGAAAFSIVFAPSQPGSVSARLLVGGETFDLSGVGLGVRLRYSYESASGTSDILANGTVLFTPLPVGRTSAVRFSVGNTGTLPATIQNIGISGNPAGFSLTGLPAFPATLDPGSAIVFNIGFAPVSVGSASAVMRINETLFTLSGSSTAPPQLPNYAFDGQAGVQDPMQQIVAGLRLLEPYGMDVTGALTLGFSSDVFANDPSIQFATGGRTVAFSIPANTTVAIFSNGSNQVRLQTGTIAGNITLTPSFQTTGGVNLTPANAPAMTLTIPVSVPRILNADVTSRSANSIVLQVTAFATNRSVREIELDFFPIGGVTLSSSRVTLNVEPSFSTWFQSTQSQQFGSLFTVSVPITVQGTLTSGGNLIDGIQALSVRLSNSVGASNPMRVELLR